MNLIRGLGEINMTTITSTSQDFLELLQSAKRGKLKIYIGSIAGTGKTYRMLQEAHELKLKGADCVLGYIETHGRPDTEKLVAGLEIVPRMKHEYHGVYIEEMDLDAVLARKPQIVVVDELAHTNLPICRNMKRFQDVIELLLAGINVICAFNVQHLESLNDLIEQTTGIKVFETVPDSFLRSADQVVNIDITAEDLIERLKAGKIYKLENVQNALTNFFVPDNIKILRELALREVAENVDRSPLKAVSQNTNNDTMLLHKPSVGKLMVCLQPEAFSQKHLLRKASRIAGRLNTDWFVVYNETTAERPEVIDSVVQRMLYNDIQLAKDLGAQFVHLKGENRVDSWIKFALKERVSHIILRAKNENWWQILFKKSVVQQLIQANKGFDIYLLNAKHEAEATEKVAS